MNWNVASKIAGGLTAAYVLYNANYTGRKVSAENVKRKAANRMLHYYIPSRRMEDRNISTSRLKDWFFRTNADWNFPDKVNAFTGYISGAFKQITYDVIPAALATGALLSKKYSKYFGIGLLAYGIKYLLCDVMDIGKPNYLKTNDF